MRSDGNQLDDEHNRKWQEHHFIEISKHRDEIWNQVDGAERIGGDQSCRELGIPRHTRITASDPERNTSRLMVRAHCFARWINPSVMPPHTDARSLVQLEYACGKPKLSTPLAG